ncbi:MAG: hypothetical protein J2P15_18850 [Micromonosporaceae bacterium]|nr:hypothetical protein [Micromonosporaceae bacterium]
MKYLMLIMDTESRRRLTAAEREAWMSEIIAWYEKAAATGKLLDGGHQLDSPDKARTVRATGVFDGPYMEAKEVLGGVSVLETETIDEAVEITKTWPGVDRGYVTIEIRPTMVN